MKSILSALLTGLVFGLGLGLAGMMNPTKVQGFLDLNGHWDPSLAFVMGGAVVVTFVVFPLIIRRSRPLLAKEFSLPSSTDLDRPLILGAVLFGIGWAISGLCPGPALANLSSLNPGVFGFVFSMFVGFWLHRQVVQVRKKQSHSGS